MRSLEEYQVLPEAEVLAQIGKAKSQLGKDLVILVHHYQRDEVIQFADFVGDSLELSRKAAETKQARYIVFCGVDFMAETAAMLCGPSQIVCLPASSAVCPMAEMADADQAQVAWQQLTLLWGEDLVPITYQNSYATVKAFCGQRGGAVCTSANAQTILRWALAQKRHALFFPDEHLGRNSALALGIPQEGIAVWDPQEPLASREAARDATPPLRGATVTPPCQRRRTKGNAHPVGHPPRGILGQGEGCARSSCRGPCVRTAPAPTTPHPPAPTAPVRQMPTPLPKFCCS